MTLDNSPNDQAVGSANTNEGGPVPGPSQTPRHVQWALKPQFEHVEQIVHSHSEDEDQSEHGRTLEEHGSDVSTDSLEDSILALISFCP
jgi:hypothetical protein